MTKSNQIDVSSSSQLSDDELLIGEPTRKALKKLTDVQKNKSLIGMRACLGAIAIYLRKKLPLENKVLKSLGFLNPQNISTVSGKVQDVQFIARTFQMKVLDIVNVTDEWKVLCMDDDVKSILRNQRVDHFWRQIFSLQTSAGEARYPYLTNVIKSGLVLPHGNADVERALSVNNSLVTPERSQLSEKVIIVLRSTKDMLKFCEPSVKSSSKVASYKENYRCCQMCSFRVFEQTRNGLLEARGGKEKKINEKS